MKGHLSHHIHPAGDVHNSKLFKICGHVALLSCPSGYLLFCNAMQLAMPANLAI